MTGIGDFLKRVAGSIVPRRARGIRNGLLWLGRPRRARGAGWGRMREMRNVQPGRGIVWEVGRCDELTQVALA
jgi:hypothetical protein